MLNIIAAYRIPLIISVVVISLAFGGDSTASLLQFEREAINNGAVWRLLTGNFVHLGWSHALLNLAGLALVWLLFNPHFSQTAWFIIFVCSLLGTTLGLFLFNPELSWYVGLSGCLHGLFIAGCIAEIKIKNRFGYVLLTIFILKILWEQFQGPLPGTSDAAGGNVIVDAHLYGALAGFCALFFNPEKTTPPPF